ncbi:MAG TPA: hypothetical protein PLD93_05400 [Synergistaceae bacterium]|nr:hypothetical protein [Synergistaceae bacterium]
MTELEKEIMETLEWYREKVRLCRSHTREGDEARAVLDRDGGSRAENAIKKARGETA